MGTKPINLVEIRARYQYDSSGAALDIYRCLDIIEALRAALEAVPSFPHNGMCQFRPSYSQLGPRACTCFVGKVQAALALVTGGKHA